MNFIRPEVRAALWRWREVLAGLAIVAVGFALVSGAYGLLPMIGGVIVFIGFLLVAAGVQRGRVKPRSGGQGLIELDEGRLTFLNREQGAIVELPEVLRIEIITTGAGPAEDDLFWVFHTTSGQVARIPGAAVGSEKLFDALAAFPGADYSKVIAASGSTEDNVFVIWQKDRRRLH